MDRPKEVLVYTIGMMVQQVLTFGTSVVVARTLGPSDFGVLSITRNIVQFILILAPLGLDLSLLKYLSDGTSPLETKLGTVRYLRRITLWVNLSVTAIFGIVIGPVLESHLYPFDHFSLYLFISACALAFSADSAAMAAVFRSIRRPLLHSYVSLYIQPTIRLILIAVFLGLGWRLAGVIGATSAAAAVTALCLNYNFRRWLTQNGLIPQPNENTGAEARTLLKASIWMAFSLLVYGLLRVLDILVLGAYVPSAVVGSYAALSSIAVVIQFVPQGMSQTLGSRVSELFSKNDKQGIEHLYSSYFRKAALVASPLLALIAVFGTNLDLILGAKFHFEMAVSVMLGLSFYVSAVLAPTGYTLSMTGRHKLELGVLALGTAAVGALLLLLVPRFGAVGAASAVFIGYLLVNVIRFGAVRKIHGLSIGSFSIVWIAAANLLLALGAKYSGDRIFERNIISVGFCVAAYLGFAAVLYAKWILSDDELRFIRSKIPGLRAQGSAL